MPDIINADFQVIDQPKPAQADSDGTYRTAATSRGSHSGIVSSQWWSRPADQRFVSLSELHAAVKARRAECTVETVNAGELRVIAKPGDNERLELAIPGKAELIKPTHWSFGQLCSLVGAPAGYLRDLPAVLAGQNLQWGLVSDRRETVKVLRRDNGEHSLLAATSETYGRIWDEEVVEAAMRIAEAAGFKVPGELDWSSASGGTVKYNPHVDITKDNTTLFASDRDVFLFLVDDLHPIEIGKLPDGSPDLVFRGFYIANSEVGRCALRAAVMYLRGVCCNRMLWGVEGFEEIRIRHSRFAPSRFVAEAVPQLRDFANRSTGRFIEGVSEAKKAIVARTDDDRKEFLDARGFSKSAAAKVIETVRDEEGKAPESVWDFVQGITAVARRIPNNDDRLELERKAGQLLAKVA